MKHAQWRYRLVVLLLLLGAMGLIWRMVDLMILNHAFLKKQGDVRSLRIVRIPAYRGMITDRNGEPLAISTPIYSVWADPNKFHADSKTLSRLAGLTNTKSSWITRRLRKHPKSHFVYLKREVTPSLAEQIRKLAIPGLFQKAEFRRYYPDGEVSAQLVGFTNIDDVGQEGIELAYNQWLQGSPGKKRVLKDRLGDIVANLDLLKPPQPGHNIALSIDRRIQYLAYRELKAAIAKFKARSGSIVVMDIQTGEVLAMVNQPSFNPNNRKTLLKNSRRNRAVTDVFEPGSTIKPFSVASALASGKFTPTTPINTEPGWMKVNGKKVEDDLDYGHINVTGVLQKSSNVGISKITLSLPPEKLWNLLHNIGFGERTGSSFPGESAGVLVNHKNWKPFVLATLSFGYGLAVTNLQLAHAYATLAANGIKRPVSLLRLQQAPHGKRVIDPKIAKEVVTMLETVVEKGGTATRASVPGYTISGKTGTVRIVGPHGYEKNHHTALFVGIAPAARPRLVVSVVIKDPRGGKFYGGLVSAPVFSKVMGSALRLMDISPVHQASTQRSVS